jgi:hypothetical protein
MRLAAIGFAYPADSLEVEHCHAATMLTIVLFCKTMKGVVADFCKLAE